MPNPNRRRRRCTLTVIVILTPTHPNQAAALHTLGLADTALGEEGGIAIAEALEGNGRLQRVDLRRNRLGLAGLMALQLSMKTNEAVREIWGDIGEIQGRYRALQLSMRTNEAVREMALDISPTSPLDLP